MVTYKRSIESSFLSARGLIGLLFTLVLVLTQPYKKAVSHYIKTNRAFLILFAMFYIAINNNYIDGTNLTGFSAYTTGYIVALTFALSLFPLLCILLLMLHSVFLRLGFFLDLVHSIHSLRGGYTAMDEDPEDGN